MKSPIETRNSIVNIALTLTNPLTNEFIFKGNIIATISKSLNNDYCKVVLDRPINLVNGDSICFESNIYNEFYSINNISEDYKTFFIMCDFVVEEQTEIVDSGQIYSDVVNVENIRNFPALVIDTGKTYYTETNVEKTTMVDNEVFFQIIDLVNNYKDKSKKRAIESCKTNVWSLSMQTLTACWKSRIDFKIEDSDLVESIINKNEDCVLFFTQLMVNAN